MTIKLLEGIQLAGVHQAVGSVLTLTPDAEARHVSSNRAVYTTLPSIGDSSVPLMATKDLTGKVEILDPTTGLPMDIGGSSLAWRPSTYFTVGANQVVDAVTSTADSALTPVVTIPVSLNFLNSEKAIRRATRFRLWFTNGLPGTAGTAFTLSGKTEVPGKNGSTSKFLPWRFNGQTSFSVPAGGGAAFCTDWMTWPLESGDSIYHKGYCYNGGASFDMPGFGSPVTAVAIHPAGKFDSGKVDHGSDVSGVAYGTSPWTSGIYTANSYKVAMVETDCYEAGRKPTVDVWGDSIGAGSPATNLLRPCWVNQVLLTAGVPYRNLCISGSNQTQIPLLAYGRMTIARGDIAICEHGRNSPNTAALSALWRFLRGLGYRKIIQTLPTDQVNYPANDTITSSSATVRAHVIANLGVGDGPDAIWDVHGAVQPSGVWIAGGTIEGLHPTTIGEDAIYAAAISSGWINDLT